jgi:hypothetical protein
MVKGIAKIGGKNQKTLSLQSKGLPGRRILPDIRRKKRRLHFLGLSQPLF